MRSEEYVSITEKCALRSDQGKMSSEKYAVKSVK